MANYQLSQVDLSTRIRLASAMLNPERPRGQVTQLAKAYGTSRKFLYELNAKSAALLADGLEAQKPGPKIGAKTISVNADYLRKAILILSLLPPSVRNIQFALQLLFAKHCSLGFVAQTLQEAGKQAQAENQRLQPARPMQAELDEIFQSGRPCLTLVDGPSGLVLSLMRQSNCDATTWGATLLELQQQGIQFEDLASDGSSSIQTGIRDAQPLVPYRPDWFHLLHNGHAISTKLEEEAYAALALVEKAHRAEQENQTNKRRQGRPLKVALSYPIAVANADRALHTFDLWAWLLDELRQTLQPIQPSGRLVNPLQARQNLTLILEWMRSLHLPRITSFANYLTELIDPILAPFETLAQALASWRSNLDPQIEAFLLWSWSNSQHFQLHIDRDLPPALQPVAHAFWQALSHFHPSSCMAECLHSWLRPFFVLHRSMPNWLLPLLQSFWNHHIFQRGKRHGFNPLALAHIQAEPDLLAWLNQLLPGHSQPN